MGLVSSAGDSADFITDIDAAIGRANVGADGDYEKYPEQVVTEIIKVFKKFHRPYFVLVSLRVLQKLFGTSSLQRQITCSSASDSKPLINVGIGVNYPIAGLAAGLNSCLAMPILR